MCSSTRNVTWFISSSTGERNTCLVFLVKLLTGKHSGKKVADSLVYQKGLFSSDTHNFCWMLLSGGFTLKKLPNSYKWIFVVETAFTLSKTFKCTHNAFLFFWKPCYFTNFTVRLLHNYEKAIGGQIHCSVNPWVANISVFFWEGVIRLNGEPCERGNMCPLLWLYT